MTLTAGLGGHCDWRLPTIAELQTILPAVAGCGAPPCSDPVFGPIGSTYWSSTISAGNAEYAWIANFVDDSVFVTGNGSGIFARAVRGGS